MFTENFNKWVFSLYEKFNHRHKWKLVKEIHKDGDVYKYWECKICGKIMSYGFSKPRWLR